MAVGEGRCCRLSVVRAVRKILISCGFLGLAVPFLFYLWIHGSSERYLWIINQGFPCSAMGGGPFQLFVLGLFPWAASCLMLAAAWGLSVRGTIRDDLGQGLVLGVALVALAVVGIFLLPSWFSTLLGC